MKVHITIQGKTVLAEVTVEVYEYLEQAERRTENLAHEQQRHWDDR